MSDTLADAIAAAAMAPDDGSLSLNFDILDAALPPSVAEAAKAMLRDDPSLARMFDFQRYLKERRTEAWREWRTSPASRAFIRCRCVVRAP